MRPLADIRWGETSTAALTCSFDSLDGWTDRWIESKHKSDFGKFVLSSGKFYGDQEKDKGKSLGRVGVRIQEDFLEESLHKTQPGYPHKPGRGWKGQSSVSNA